MGDRDVVDVVGIGAVDRLGGMLDNVSVLGVDTEFVREKTFFAELCLVQIATGDRIVCVDPLAGGDAVPFWDRMLEHHWVVHSGRQDLEVIYHTAGRLPTTIFDTQVAAALLGFAPQIGYANLVSELFEVTLAKSHTRADWSRRPLPEALIEYAAEDVEFLLPARELLMERLDRAGRLEWAEQDSMDLIDTSLYSIDPRLAVDRLKGARNMRGSQRAAAARLATWREQQALDRNRPRQWIMKDAVLLAIAQAQPGTREALLAVPGIPERTAKRASRELLQIVRDAAGDRQDYLPPARPDESQKQVLKRMQAAVTECAEQLGVATEIIAPRRELSAALRGDRGSRVFRGWRRELVGAELLEMLDDCGSPS